VFYPYYTDDDPVASKRVAVKITKNKVLLTTLFIT